MNEILLYVVKLWVCFILVKIFEFWLFYLFIIVLFLLCWNLKDIFDDFYFRGLFIYVDICLVCKLYKIKIINIKSLWFVWGIFGFWKLKIWGVIIGLFLMNVLFFKCWFDLLVVVNVGGSNGGF